MVYGTVRQSGGSIRVESTVGVGTTFSMYFPTVDDAAQEEEAGPSTASPSGQHGDTLVAKVLVVEEDAQVRKAATRVLANAGFDVLTAGSAEQALELLESGATVGAVLTDLNLQGMSGHRLLERVREAWPELPVIVMSGYAGGSPGRDGLPPDVSFVQKPFTPVSLVNAVREILR